MDNRIKYLFIHKPLHSLNTIRNLISTKIRSTSLSSEPRMVQIEVTNKCNMRCIQCSRTNHFLANKKPLDTGCLNFRNFVKILEQFEYLDIVSLQGLGEPFLNPDIFDIIKYAKRRNISITTSTNASLLGEEVCKKLVDSGIDKKDEVSISIDSFNAESFEKIRPSIKFNDIVNNLNIFMDTCGGKINIIFHLVITNENIEDLEDYIRTVDRYGAKHIAFSDQNISWAGDNINGLLIKNPARLRKVIDNVSKMSRDKALDFKYFKLDSHTWPLKEIKHRCWFVWSLPYITWDGFVTPCCTTPYPKEFNFGNLFEINFREIWNSKKYREFRRLLKNKKTPTVCQRCPLSEGAIR